MKNKIFIVLLAAIICGAFLTGCGTIGGASASVSDSHVGRFGQVSVPAKDFESRGLVFTETRLQVISQRGSINGEILTYQALLREAQRLGADAIINVVIDKREDKVIANDILTETTIWYGSALAIRYTDAVNELAIVVNDSSLSAGSLGTGGGNFSDDSGQGKGGLFGGLFGR